MPATSGPGAPRPPGRGRRLLAAAALVLSGVVVGAALPRGGARAAGTDPLASVRTAYDLLVGNFAGKLTPAALVAGAIKGMAAATGDPFTDYLAPSADQGFTDVLNGFGGIGVVINMMGSGAVIQSVLAGAPAQKAGLRGGDEIIAVNGKSIAGMDAAAVAALIRGKIGTTVALDVMRVGHQQAIPFTLTRADISQPTVFVTGQPAPGIAVVKISQFTATTGAEFDRTLARLRAQPAGLRGLVLDLRGDPGGYVAAALHVADEIAPAGPVLEIVDRQGKTTTYTAPAHAPFPPTVVLVDGGTASAAEILAGALQATHAATLVGSRTYGKGSVQRLFQLPGGGAIKITVAHDELPNGKSWEHTGLTPDVPVQPAAPATAQLPTFAAVGSRDLQPGMIGLDVYGLQQRLALLGYYRGQDSGIYDTNTQASVEIFERDSKLPTTGDMAAADWQALAKAVGAKIQALGKKTPPDTVLTKGLQVLQSLISGAGGGAAAAGG